MLKKLIKNKIIISIIASLRNGLILNFRSSKKPRVKIDIDRNM